MNTFSEYVIGILLVLFSVQTCTETEKSGNSSTDAHDDDIADASVANPIENTSNNNTAVNKYVVNRATEENDTDSVNGITGPLNLNTSLSKVLREGASNDSETKNATDFLELLEYLSPEEVLAKIVEILRNLKIDIRDIEDRVSPEIVNYRKRQERTFIYKICDQNYLINICLYNIINTFDEACEKYQCSAAVLPKAWQLAKLKCVNDMKDRNPTKIDEKPFTRNKKMRHPPIRN